MSTNNKGEFNLKMLIPIVLLITISISAYILLKNDKENTYTEDPLKTEGQRISEIKKELKSLLPEKYKIIEKSFESPSLENNGCIFLYEIYPKEYSEIEKQYLESATLIYCEDINTAVLEDQTEEVRYSKTEGKWFYGEMVNPIEEKQYGENLVSIVGLGGSHVLSNYYIVRIDNSDELVILSIPTSNRIRCDDGVGGVKDEDCVTFITSIGMSPDSTDFVPEEVYEEHYNELLETLKYKHL